MAAMFFYSGPEQTNQTLTLDRAVHIFACATIGLHARHTGEVSVGCNVAMSPLDATKPYKLDL